MTEDETGVTFSDADYDAIEAAVMETVRGRWFLREFARRNRNADTEAVLSALRELEKTVHDGEAERALAEIRAGLQTMAATIARTKRELGLVPRNGGQDDLASFLGSLPDADGSASEEEFQALAEQRIRRMIQTLRYLEGRIHGLMAACAPQPPAPDGGATFPEAAALAEDPTLHPGPHPSFLM
ncbi:MAG TPA: hypothetical protein VEZ16_03360 [Microvirga sp.]|nr:hypothetical protein [Microvirga sp.]